LRKESGAGNEVVVASAHLSSKQGLNDDPPPNLTVAEKVIAETAPFQMIRRKRDLEDNLFLSSESDSESDSSGKKKKSQCA
jgi:hypothetical protein